LLIVIALSIVVGLGAILLFAYTSDQKAIGIATNRIKAHLLALQLYQDQPSVVLGSYAKIPRGTGRYLRLAFKPLLYVVIPITLLVVELDRVLGVTPIQTNTAFLLTARVSDVTAVDGIGIELPAEIVASALPVHISADHEVVWRLVASREGAYEVEIAGNGESVVKTVRVSAGLARVSPARLRGHFWERIVLSGEPALPANSAFESIRVDYPESSIPLGIGGYEMNWIWLFFILSMAAGFIFKTLLGIRV
jgi:hypothetical protein